MRLSALAVLAALLPALAHAQSTITGRVTDTGDRPLPGVSVSVSGTGAIPQSRVAITNSTGRFTVAGLPDDAYTVRFVLPGFDPEVRSGIEVGGGAATVDVVMRVGALEEPQLVVPGSPGLLPLPRRDQGPGCPHGADESPEDAARREEALAAMRLIYAIVDQMFEVGRRTRTYVPRTWEGLSALPLIDRLRESPGPTGDLARRIQWGTNEPLPGWRLDYVASPAHVRFTLTDVRDPCGFSYSSADPEIAGRGVRIVPLT